MIDYNKVIKYIYRWRMHMVDQKLLSLLAIEEYGGFTKAAKGLSMTQPALSHHMRLLEEDYGVKLFHYQHRQLLWTNEGEVLIAYARSLVYQEQAVRKALLELQNPRRKRAFGGTLTLGEFSLAPHLKTFFQGHPDVDFSLKIDNTKEVMSLLEEGILDFCLVEGLFPKEGYDVILLKEVPFVLLVSPGHPLAKERKVSLEELFAYPLILREEGSGSRDIVEKALAERGYDIHGFQKIIEIGNISLMKRLTEEALGISFMYEDAARKELAENTLVQVAVKNLHLTREFNFVMMKNHLEKDEILGYAKEFQGFFAKEAGRF